MRGHARKSCVGLVDTGGSLSGEGSIIAIDCIDGRVYDVVDVIG
jgi:hypothetical protein